MVDRGVGTVHELHRYPLKSADGEALDAVRVDGSGLEDDRRWALVSPDGDAVTAKEVPDLRTATARSADGVVQVLSRGGWVGGDDAETALSALAGRAVRLDDARTRPGASHQQVAAVHLVSVGAVSAADAPTGCDPVPRANLVLALDEPGAERGWLGRRVAVGDLVLEVTRTPSSCLGVYAEVVTAGVVRRGDAVALLPADTEESG